MVTFKKIDSIGISLQNISTFFFTTKGQFNSKLIQTDTNVEFSSWNFPIKKNPATLKRTFGN